MTPARLALFVSLLTCPVLAPVLAKEPDERYECQVMLACDISQPCRDDDGTVIDLAFSGTSLTVTYGGQPLDADFDPRFRSAIWLLGDVVMQMRFVGDGSGVITVTPEAGEVERTQVQLFHCSPA